MMRKMHILLALHLFVLCVFTSSVPTILDTDIGTAFDDQLALTFMLARPDLFDIKLIICSTSNTTARAQIVAKTLSIFKRFDIPIGIGQYKDDDNHVYEYRWSEDYSLDQFKKDGGLVFLDGEQALFDEMSKASADNIYHYIQISPSTSLGNVLQRQPSLSTYMKLFAMGGSIYSGYENSSSPSREYNIYYDTPASQIMFSSNWTYFSLSTLDCTNFMQFYGPLWKNFLSHRSSSRIVNMVIESFTIWYNDGGKILPSTLPYTPELGTPEMYDALAAYLASIYTSVKPAVLTFLPLFVTDDGYTRENQTLNRKIDACLKFETSDPYISTEQIGSFILESIIRANPNTNEGHCLSSNMYFLIFLLINIFYIVMV